MITKDEIRLMKDTLVELAEKCENLKQFVEYIENRENPKPLYQPLLPPDEDGFKTTDWSLDTYRWDKIKTWKQLMFYMMANPVAFRYSRDDKRERKIFWSKGHLNITDDGGGTILEEQDFVPDCYVLVNKIALATLVHSRKVGVK